MTMNLKKQLTFPLIGNQNLFFNHGKHGKRGKFVEVLL